MVNVLKQSFRGLLNNWKIVLVIYLLSLIVSLLVARPFYVTILTEANGTVALDALIPKFDFMIFSDFINQSIKAFRPFLSFTAIVFVFFGLVYTFLSGGILDIFESGVFDSISFFQNSLKFFGKFLVILIFELILIIIAICFAGIFFFIFASIAEGGTERTYFYAMLPPLILLIYFLSVAFLSAEYARISIFKTDNKTWSSFLNSIGFVIRKPLTLGLFWLICVIGIVISLFYLGIDSFIGMSSGLTIFIMFLVQQLVIFGRAFLKLLHTGAAFKYYTSINFESSKIDPFANSIEPVVV